MANKIQFEHLMKYKKEQRKLNKNPLDYKGFMIRLHEHNNNYCAYDWRTDYFINPLYKTIGEIKNKIDEVTKEINDENICFY
jgi:hypothetical protein